MKPIDVIAVVGACSPERAQFARRYAQEIRCSLIPATRLRHETNPALVAAELIQGSHSDPRVVAEFPASAVAEHIIGAFASSVGQVKLSELLCVVDAAHILRDLSVQDFLVTSWDQFGEPAGYVARAGLTVAQIEFATTVVFVNWQAVRSEELSTMMGLISALAPQAQLVLDEHPDDELGSPVSVPESTQLNTAESAALGAVQDRAGWISVINGDHSPALSDPRVMSFCYEQLRPFHPQRLARLIEDRLDSGEFGRIVRSAGFCQFATRPGTTMQWDQVGGVIAFNIVSEQLTDALAPAGSGADPDSVELLVFGQQIAFIGLDLNEQALIQALDEAVLTDSEFSAGVEHWVRIPDPFPVSTG